MDTETPETGSRFKQGKALLWPVGGALLGLVVVPVAIEQYPELFKENEWILPLSLFVMVACWVSPFFFHSRAKRFTQWLASIPRVGKVAAILAPLLIISGLFFGAKRVFVFHRDHLRSRLQREQKPPAAPVSLQVASLEFDHTALIFHIQKKAIFVAGQPAAMRVVYGNTNDGTAHQTAPNAALEIIPNGPDLRSSEQARWKDFRLNWLASSDNTTGPDLGGHKTKFFDVFSRKLSRADVFKLTRRPPKEFIYIFGILGWTDETGKYETDICSYYLPGMSMNPSLATFHDCLSGHNVIRSKITQVP